VSPGCDHCYAEAIARRFHGGFHLRLKPQRLNELHRFKPVEENGRLAPRVVFVNSMSDLWHEDIPESYLDSVFEVIEAHPRAVFQCITKRHKRLNAYARNRWKAGGVPTNVWLGVSVESDTYRFRIETLRRLKDSLGGFTALVNSEPILGPLPRHDYTDMDWLIVGGESGAGARPMKEAWLRQAIDAARRSNTAIWFKAWGRWENNPAWPQAEGRTRKEKKQDLVDRGLELLPEEHGGATIDGALIQERPPSFRRIGGALDGAEDS